MGEIDRRIIGQLSQTSRPDCPTIRELGEFLDQRIDAQRKALIETHVRSCPACINRLIELRELVANPWHWMSRALAFVLPSRYEGFGSVLVEAMACDTSVVATDWEYGPRANARRLDLPMRLAFALSSTWQSGDDVDRPCDRAGTTAPQTLLASWRLSPSTPVVELRTIRRCSDIGADPLEANRSGHRS